MNKIKFKIEIITANQKHIPEIALIAEKQLGYTHLFKNELLDAKSIIYCALHNNKVHGYAMGKLFSNTSFFNNYKKLIYLKTNTFKKVKTIGVLVSIAVKSKYQHKGIGTKLVFEILKKFRELNVNIALMTAWKSKSGVSMHKIADRLGFKTIIEIENYWKENSQKHGYQCPDCGPPPCKCACVVYVLKL